MPGFLSLFGHSNSTPPATAPTTGEAANVSCINVKCLPGKWNPGNWDIETAKRITHLAGVILAICIVAIAICILIPGAYHTIFGGAGILSLIALICSIVRRCEKGSPILSDQAFDTITHVLDKEKPTEAKIEDTSQQTNQDKK